MANRIQDSLFEDRERSFWIVPLEALLVLKVREHLHYPDDLKHIDDIRKLIARNHDQLDKEELGSLLELKEEWQGTWENLVEGSSGPP